MARPLTTFASKDDRGVRASEEADILSAPVVLVRNYNAFDSHHRLAACRDEPATEPTRKWRDYGVRSAAYSRSAGEPKAVGSCSWLLVLSIASTFGDDHLRDWKAGLREKMTLDCRNIVQLMRVRSRLIEIPAEPANCRIDRFLGARDSGDLIGRRQPGTFADRRNQDWLYRHGLPP